LSLHPGGLRAHRRVVNNAAIDPRGSIEDETFERFERTNASIVRNLVGHEGGHPSDAGRGRGSIVNISSTAGMQIPGYTSYGSSKWAVRGMTKSAARDSGRTGSA